MSKDKPDKIISTKYCNNTIYLESNKRIQKDDLELIILYFENSKLSGGYDILRYELVGVDQSTLQINYKYNESKQEIMRRNKFKYDKYEFTVRDAKPPITTALVSPKKINNLLIFNNIDVQSTDILELYIDYLLQGDSESSNTIEKIVKSILFQNTYYVHFKNDVNFDLISKRLLKKPNLRNRLVQIYEAFELNQLILSLNSLQGLNLNQFEDQFDQMFNRPSDGVYWELPFKSKSPYLLVHFKTLKQVQDVIKKGFQVDKVGKFDVELCYNYEFMDRYIDEFLNKVKNTNADDDNDEDSSSTSSSSSSHDNDDEQQKQLKAIKVEKLDSQVINDQKLEVKSEMQVTSNGYLINKFIANDIHGVVARFNKASFYGFIERENIQGESYWFHGTSVRDYNHKTHRNENVENAILGKQVLFDVVATAKGFQAINVRSINGSPFFDKLAQAPIEDQQANNEESNDSNARKRRSTNCINEDSRSNTKRSNITTTTTNNNKNRKAK